MHDVGVLISDVPNPLPVGTDFRRIKVRFVGRQRPKNFAARRIVDVQLATLAKVGQYLRSNGPICRVTGLDVFFVNALARCNVPEVYAECVGRGDKLSAIRAKRHGVDEAVRCLRTSVAPQVDFMDRFSRLGISDADSVVVRRCDDGLAIW